MVRNSFEWGEPGPPTADQDHQDQLGPCMCTPRRYRYKSYRADPILRTSDTCFSVTELPTVPWPDLSPIGPQPRYLGAAGLVRFLVGCFGRISDRTNLSSQVGC